MSIQKEIKKDTRTVATILFSGGYDSTAVLYKLIDDNKYKTINVIYENITNAPDGYHDIGRNKAKQLFNLLDKKAKHKNICLTWRDVDFDSIINMPNGCDTLLMLHLMTILSYGGKNVYDIYLSWNKQHINNLAALGYFKMSKQFLKMIRTNLASDITIHYLEDSFPNAENELQRKAQVIEYLLSHNLFGYCYSYEEMIDGYKQFENERKQYLAKELWFFNKDNKSKETATALIQTGLFSQQDLVKLFSFHTTWAIQNYYNKIRKQKEIKQKEENRYAVG